MNLELIFSIMFKMLGLGAIFFILYLMLSKIESLVPEPFKVFVKWFTVFVFLIGGVIVIYFIADLVGIGTNGNMSISDK